MKDDEMRYPEYCFVDSALGDVKYRNRVVKLSEVSLPDPPVECYLSMFGFKEEYKEHCENTGSVKEIDDLPCYCDYLWFDIDDNNLEKARERAIELMLSLEALYETDAIVYFSGNKGFHIGVPSEVFGAKPSANLPQVFKRMAKLIASDIPVDYSIYEKNRLWRMPGSINRKSGLYKIPLTPEDLAQLDIQTIKELAATKRQITAATSPINKRSEALTALYNNIIREIEQSEKKTDAGPATKISGIEKPCIKKLLEGVESGQRNEAAIRIADYFRKRESSPEDAEKLLIDWNERNKEPLPTAEIHDIVKSAYSGNYDYGCNDPILKAACSSECPLKKKSKDGKPVLISFIELSDGSLLEMLYNRKADPQTTFARFYNGLVEYVDEDTDPSTGIVYQPIKPGKIIQSHTIHFPSKAEEYGNEILLLGQIDDFISKYLVVTPFFHGICKYYVLLSWVYDNFTVVPYLRVRADYGCGKSRFLKTVGSLCYKPIFCSGAATVSPIFRLIDTYRGTLIVDESDFTDSDESHRVVKILNSGFQEGFPVLLTESLAANKLEPTSFEVFGPKLIASRHEFKDKALESRCITEVMDNKIGRDIPLDLPKTFWDEATQIRNQLLMWRFRKWGQIELIENNLRGLVEPRLAQIMTPLMSVIDDQDIKDEFVEFMKTRNQQLIEDRGESLDGKVAQAVCDLWEDESIDVIRVKQIADATNNMLDNPKFEIKSRKTGEILRKTFNFNMQRDGKGYFLERTDANLEKLQNIARKHGIDWGYPGKRSQRAQCASPVEEQGVTL